MTVLLMQLIGPMQAWGTSSRFDERDTQLEPSKSGVIGLICAALGRDRSEPVTDLAALAMAVRVDREGLLMRDFQTAGGDREDCKTLLLASGEVKSRTVVSPRFYLADAAFLLGLQGDRGLLEHILAALRAPHWPLALGRKSMPPSKPLWTHEPLQERELLEVLQRTPAIAKQRLEHQGQPVRLLHEHPSEGSVRLDQPLGSFAERRFGPRYIKTELCHVPDPITD